MKKSKVFLAAGVVLLSASFLAACGSSSSNSASGSKSYSYVYIGEPETLDYIQTSKATTHDITTNGIDGLLENDRYGNLVPSIAEDWKVSKDGLTYTYKIRKGVKWYTTEGEEYAEVKAQDFVTGLKHAADGQSEQLSLVQDSIKGLKEYVDGTNKDFASVGVKAVDDYTLEFTLNKPESFWNSKTTSSILYPVNEEFLKAKGKDFGQSTKPDSILYNGPFILKSITSKSSIELVKNENYWDKDNVHIDSIKLAYWDGQDQDALARTFTDGGYSVARVYPGSSSYDGIKKQYADNIYTTEPGSGTGLIGINLDRKSFEHTSKTTDDEKNATQKALLNKDFRQALGFAIDRQAFSAQVNGKDGADAAIRNLFVPSDFVTIGDKNFGQVVQDKLTAMGDEWKDVDLSDSQNGLYNPEKAKAEFAKAKTALEANGVKFPIHLDVPTVQTSTSHVARMQSLKQSIEDTLGKENVTVDLQMMTEEDALNVTYYAASADKEDWDLNGLVAWNPDYQDPSTYLDIFNPSNEENTKTYMGFGGGAENASAKAVGLDEYVKLLDDADNETIDAVKRYEKFAAAQAWLTDNALAIPTMAGSGAASVISRHVPFTRAYAQTGNKDGATYFKYLEVGDKVVTKVDYDKAREKWVKEKAESNQKAQEELAKHVE